MVYALQKFRNYLLGDHFKIFIDHSSLNYLVNNPKLGGNICRWLLLFQEFDFEIIVNLDRLNVGPNHLSPIEIGEETKNIEHELLYVQLFIFDMEDEYYDQIM